jgi:hypothetical protein
MKSLGAIILLISKRRLPRGFAKKLYTCSLVSIEPKSNCEPCILLLSFSGIFVSPSGHLVELGVNSQRAWQLGGIQFSSTVGLSINAVHQPDHDP